MVLNPCQSQNQYGYIEYLKTLRRISLRVSSFPSCLVTSISEVTESEDSVQCKSSSSYTLAEYNANHQNHKKGFEKGCGIQDVCLAHSTAAKCKFWISSTLPNSFSREGHF